MTWICAASTIFGYGALYSDVQVTFRDGGTRDLLQKAYPLSNFIAAGFAGSVHIGFMLLDSLHRFLHIPQGDLSRVAWDPVWVSRSWAPIAKSVFDQAPPMEKMLGSRVLMLGTSPTENSGLGSKVYFTRFCEPDFHPGIMARPIKFCGIGTGASVSEYKLRMKPLFRLTSNIHKAEIGQPGGWARQLGFSISRELADFPRTGISRHVHIIIVTRGSIIVETNDENIYRGEEPRIEIRMPRVARGYEEFRSLAASCGHDSAGASC
jgi:hypothetical protein